MSLTELAALFQAAGDSDAVRDRIQAFVEEMLIEPQDLDGRVVTERSCQGITTFGRDLL